jgi:hypothetical protein
MARYQTVNIYPTAKGGYRLLLNTWDSTKPSPICSRQVGKFSTFCEAITRKAQLMESLRLAGIPTTAEQGVYHLEQ